MVDIATVVDVVVVAVGAEDEVVVDVVVVVVFDMPVDDDEPSDMGDERTP